MYLSNKVRQDGMGSKLVKIVNLMGAVEYLKSFGADVDFVYTPLSYGRTGAINENELRFLKPDGELVDPEREFFEWTANWENMLGYKGLTIHDVDINTVTFCTHPPQELGNKFVGKNHSLVDHNMALHETRKYRGTILNQFSIAEKVKKPYIDVAVHIRRSDVVKKGSWTKERWLDDEYFLAVIKQIENCLGSDCKVTIYTQRHGTGGRFLNTFNPRLFKGYDIVYDDELPDYQTWLKLYHSDILVLSISSFSYTAALLGDSIAIHPGKRQAGGPLLNGFVDFKKINTISKKGINSG